MKLKILLPFDNGNLLTDLSPKEIKQKLEDLLKKPCYKPAFLTRDTRIRFEGRVSDSSFEICREDDGRRSAVPEIKGTVSTKMGKALIVMKLRLNLFHKIFMILWMGISGLLCLGVLLKFDELKESFRNMPFLVNWVPFIFFIFGYIIMLFTFKRESYKTKKFLKQLLEAKEY